MKIAVLLSLIGLAVSAEIKFKTDKQVVDETWATWKTKHSKKYADAGEERVRYVIWKDNLNFIEEYNKNTTRGIVLAINEFGDMTNTEYRKTMNGYIPSNNTEHESTFLPPENFQAPISIDWRQHGLVTPIKNQGQCGSCWSFSTTGTLEGQMKRKTQRLVSLSEQNLVDCSTQRNHGCNGGLPSLALHWIHDNNGIDTEASYPYQAHQYNCRFNRQNVAGHVNGVMRVRSGSESALREAVGANGPVSIAIDASHRSFQFYHSGIYYEPNCSSERLDHAVLVVGYGENSRGWGYWIVKNSWGTNWGAQGYVYMLRNYGNMCGVATNAVFPTV